MTAGETTPPGQWVYNSINKCSLNEVPSFKKVVIQCNTSATAARLCSYISCEDATLVMDICLQNLPQCWFIVKVPWKKYTFYTEIDTQSHFQHVFSKHLNFLQGTTWICFHGWLGFTWRSSHGSQSKQAHVSVSESLSCSLAGTGSGRVNRGNPTCWRGSATELSSSMSLPLA